METRVILDLGGERYAMYAHMQPGSIRVHKGERVKVGQMIGLVGNSGNSVAPHLHFQVKDRPSSLASNGLPYEIKRVSMLPGRLRARRLLMRRRRRGLRSRLRRIALLAQQVKRAMPLDQLIISFTAR